MAVDTYPNVAQEQTHEDGDQMGTVGPVHGRRPVPELWDDDLEELQLDHLLLCTVSLS